MKRMFTVWMVVMAFIAIMALIIPWLFFLDHAVRYWGLPSGLAVVIYLGSPALAVIGLDALVIRMVEA